MDNYQLEKLFEVLHNEIELAVGPEGRAHCPALAILESLLQNMSASNGYEMAADLGLKTGLRCDHCGKCEPKAR